jgi:hypothetical protein
MLFCRHSNCGKPFESMAGDQPGICPFCRRDAWWSTTPGDGRNPGKPRRVKPTVAFALSFNDKRFLKSLRIDPEGPSDPVIADDLA